MLDQEQPHQCTNEGKIINFIGSMGLISTAGIIIFLFALAWKGKEVPVSVAALLAGVSGLAGNALGSLGSMLARLRGADATGTKTDPIVTTPANTEATDVHTTNE